MYQQPTQSYRIGDFLKPKSEVPDGDFLGIGANVETSRTQDGKSQIKLTANLVQLQKAHSWYYTFTREAIWRLFKDLVAGGILTPESEVALPIEGPDAAAAWIAPLQAAWINQPFMLQVTTRGEYQNTTIRGRGDAMAAAPIQAPPAAVAPAQPPLGTRQNGFVLTETGWQPEGNAPGPTGGGVMGGPSQGSGFSFMRPHTGPEKTMFPAASQPVAPNAPPAAAAPSGGPPTTYGNVSELFRGQ